MPSSPSSTSAVVVDEATHSDETIHCDCSQGPFHCMKRAYFTEPHPIAVLILTSIGALMASIQNSALLLAFPTIIEELQVSITGTSRACLEQEGGRSSKQARPLCLVALGASPLPLPCLHPFLGSLVLHPIFIRRLVLPGQMPARASARP